MVHVGSSGVVSRILLHLSFQIRYAHSDIMMRSRWVAPLRTCPSWLRTFRNGRAMMVVMSRFDGHCIFLRSLIISAIFQIILVWLASQLKEDVAWFLMCRILGRFLFRCTYPFLASSFHSWISFHRKLRTFIERSLWFLCIARQIHSSVGEPSPRSCRVDLVSSRLDFVCFRSLVF